MECHIVRAGAFGLAMGLRPFSVYAFLQRDPCREVFTTTFLAMVASLDMQIPTLLMRDFNSTVSPGRDLFTPDEERQVSVCCLACWDLVAPFWSG